MSQSQYKLPFDVSISQLFKQKCIKCDPNSKADILSYKKGKREYKKIEQSFFQGAWSSILVWCVQQDSEKLAKKVQPDKVPEVYNATIK